MGDVVYVPVLKPKILLINKHLFKVNEVQLC